MLDSIEIEGYKSIANARVDLGPLNVLIGANGSGKSNFVSAFRVIRQIVDQRLQESVQSVGGADRWLRYGQKRTPELRFRVRFSPNSYEVRLVPSDDGSLILFDERAEVGSDLFAPSNAHHASVSRESTLRSGGLPIPFLEAIESWRSFHFHDTSRSAGVKQPGPIDDNVALREDGSNLAAVLFRTMTTHPAAFSQIVAAIRQVAPFFEKFTLQPSRLNPNVIKLEWKERGSDQYLDAHSLSDGTLRFICMVTMLRQPQRPQVLVIDEPELGLHPFAIVYLANLFRSVTVESGMQIVAATQSTALVNQLDPAEIIVVDRDAQDASVFRRPRATEIEAWLEEYALGELWEKNVIGGRPQ